jgi:hypothetical protein
MFTGRARIRGSPINVSENLTLAPSNITILGREEG